MFSGTRKPDKHQCFVLEGRGADRLVIGEIGGVIVVERGATFRYVPAGLHGLNGVDKMGGERWGASDGG